METTATNEPLQFSRYHAAAGTRCRQPGFWVASAQSQGPKRLVLLFVRHHAQEVHDKPPTRHCHVAVAPLLLMPPSWARSSQSLPTLDESTGATGPVV